GAVEPAPATPKPAWNQPAVGASALEQLDSEPPAPEPGAAKELFGSVPDGASLGAADDYLGAPEVLASPEEVLRPVAIDHDDPEPIYRSDVKAIFFMLAPGEPPQAGDGTKVRVTFSDGRVIEGVRDGVDAKHGFFLVPLDAARTNTRRIYVAREATSDIKDG